jgi:aflatoxin B1 aldehyde reductase
VNTQYASISQNHSIESATAAFDALDIIRTAAEKHGLTVSEPALRWLIHHSAINEEKGDKIIIGAGSKKHFEENLAGFKKGPLPEDVVDALDQARAKTKPVARNYYH